MLAGQHANALIWRHRRRCFLREQHSVMRRMLPVARPIEASDARGEVLRFGSFALYRNERLLLDGTEPVQIGSRALEILIALVNRAGHVVSKEELISQVWPQTFVEETNLRVHIAALRLSDAFSEGAYFIDLAGISDPLLISNAFVAVLGLTAGKDDPIDDLLAFFQDRRMLLVLDNCEHVIEAAAKIAEDILKGAAHVHILATSREPLRAEGEHQYQLAHLDVPTTLDAITATSANEFP